MTGLGESRREPEMHDRLMGRRATVGRTLQHIFRSTDSPSTAPTEKRLWCNAIRGMRS